jgi:PIN domain nuclease of toxin-antitoxin system
VILLDTHVLIWAVEQDPRLGQQATLEINAAAQDGGLRVSAITPWEIAMLVTKDRLALSRETSSWFRTVLSQPGLALVPIEPEIAIHAGQLPRFIHGDPADRLIIATAAILGCPLMTVDRAILAYAKAGHLQAIDARR